MWRSYTTDQFGKKKWMEKKKKRPQFSVGQFPWNRRWGEPVRLWVTDPRWWTEPAVDWRLRRPPRLQWDSALCYWVPFLVVISAIVIVIWNARVALCPLYMDYCCCYCCCYFYCLLLQPWHIVPLVLYCWHHPHSSLKSIKTIRFDHRLLIQRWIFI